MRLAAPICLQFSPVGHRTACLKGHSEPRCICNAPLPPQTQPLLPGVKWDPVRKHVNSMAWEVSAQKKTKTNSAKSTFYMIV